MAASAFPTRPPAPMTIALGTAAAILVDAQQVVNDDLKFLEFVLLMRQKEYGES